ncbi:IclR family transcriptional regulator domain-containing protein, partial [Klebsiella pneumoniae]|uniref:IclR family transcriptional regulator domain-containing protein n=1 Tax=Klebsiella pneumoniae TaxID=573 RepID=UPI00272E9458
WFGGMGIIVLVPIFCTAGGRLWLASLPEAECETVLQRITREQRTPYTVTDIASLMEKIAQVRRQGYATIEQEFEIAARSPVFCRCGSAPAPRP